ncbi:MAG: DUF493 domain-containing protein [Candidatus Binatia bacterium]
MAPESLEEFPCLYTFKIFGRESATFAERVRVIIAETLGPVPSEAVSARASSGGKYLSLTIVVRVETQAQLERVYQDLRADPAVLLYI